MTLFALAYLALIAAGIVTNVIFCLYTWSRARTRGAVLLAVLLALATGIALSYFLTRIGVSRGAVAPSIALRFFSLAYAPVVMLLFTLDFAGFRRWLNWRVMLALLVVPTLTQLAVLTNESLGGMFEVWWLEKLAGLTVVQYTPGPFWYVHTLYSYVMVTVTLAILLWRIRMLRALARRQYVTVLVGALAVVVPNVLYILAPNGPVSLDLTPIGTSIMGVCVWLAVFRFNLVDEVLNARSLAIDHIQEGIFVVDQHQMVVDLNDAALAITGRAYRDVLGKPMSELLGMALPALPEDGPVEVSLDRGGQPRSYEVRLSPLFGRAQQMGHVLIFYDVTQRRLAQEREVALRVERERNRMLSYFVRSTSHDLRTPLSVISTSLYLARRAEDAGQREVRLANAEAQIARINHMISDMHLLAILESDRQPTLQLFRMQELLSPTADYIRAEIERKHLHCEFSMDGDVMVNADPGLLRHAYQHLLQNAVEYTPEGGQVWVRVLRANGHAVLQVSDSGPGIAPEQREQLFEMFTRADVARTPSRSGGGAGLGLPIARRIAEAHHGEITLTSEVGRGSTFSLVLPAADEPVPAAPAP
jgi:signal transduction histidine kinase